MDNVRCRSISVGKGYREGPSLWPEQWLAGSRARQGNWRPTTLHSLVWSELVCFDPSTSAVTAPRQAEDVPVPAGTGRSKGIKGIGWSRNVFRKLQLRSFHCWWRIWKEFVVVIGQVSVCMRPVLCSSCRTGAEERKLGIPGRRGALIKKRLFMDRQVGESVNWMASV